MALNHRFVWFVMLGPWFCVAGFLKEGLTRDEFHGVEQPAHPRRMHAACFGYQFKDWQVG
jgi:hypothetical protein